MATGSDGTQPVLGYGDECLRQHCRAVEPDEDVSALADLMKQTMLESNGVGLAASQIGDRRRVITVVDPTRRPHKPMVLINPEILETFGPGTVFEEGCLSFPGLYMDLTRPRGLEVRYRTLEGDERVLRNEGILARIIQHEVDHLDGVLFIDHLPTWQRWLLFWRLWRLRRSARKVAA